MYINQGLKRVRVFFKDRDKEFGVPEICTQWLLEDTEDYFVVLVDHVSRRLHTSHHDKKEFYFKEAIG